MHFALWQWSLLALVGVMVGMAKTGVPGLGMLAVPITAEIVPVAVMGTGLLTPILSTADVFGVWLYRRHANAHLLWHLVPWVAIGGVAGFLVMGRCSSHALKTIIAAIVLVMLAVHLIRMRWSEQGAVHDWRVAACYGVVAGFATMVANAAGPVMGLYLLSMGLSKDDYIGTGAWFFMVVNLAKVPFFLALHPPIITPASLFADACVIPAVAIGAYSGRRLMALVPQRAFEMAVLALTLAAVVMLLWPSPTPATPSPTPSTSATHAALQR
jgi:uncharacterized membrane protein YfcA